jgi:hypothetical protein
MSNCCSSRDARTTLLCLQVVASRVCAPGIHAAAELLSHEDDIVSVKAGREVRSRLGKLKQALDKVLCESKG